MSDTDRRSFDAVQQAYFDQAADHFTQPIPEDVQERTAQIVAAARLNSSCRVLDVGTGAGVLIDHFANSGVQRENIIGCDLSQSMLARAKERHPGTSFWQGDIVDFPVSFGRFDAIFFNACFGNFFDQDKVIEHSAALLTETGCLVISHPMGGSFVAALNEQYPQIVPHLLPDKTCLTNWAHKHNLKLETYCDKSLLYIAVLRSRTRK